MKRFIGTAIAATLVVGTSLSAFAADLSVKVNGTPVAFTDSKPYIDENGRTLVPLRAIADAMNLEVEWDDATKTASFSNDTVCTSFKIGEKSYDVTTTTTSDAVVVNVPADEDSTDNTSAKDTTADETEAADKTADETKAADKTADETKAADKTADETKAADKTADETEAADTTADETEAADETAATVEKTETTTDEMDTAAVIKDSRTYAPVRFIAESFGYKVGWDAETSTVTLDK
jgi:cobalamin biosynthesis protein CobT